MKTVQLFGILILLAAVLLLALSMTGLIQPASTTQHSGAALSAQISLPDPPSNPSEIGSTDGIMLMGVVIVLIVLLPLFFRKK